MNVRFAAVAGVRFWLLGTPRVHQDLAAGRPVDEILKADDAGHAAWRAERRAALLY